MDDDAKALARVGRVLGDKWMLERLIGVGGMAAVYAGRHRNGARAAVKVLHPTLAKDSAIRERFLREGYAANRVEHRGAVQVLDDDVVKEGEDEGTAYLVMELLEGESLEDRARREKLGEREFLEIAEEVLDVLGAAHAHGVVHRDLKPENLFLSSNVEPGSPRVKVLDFGLARLAEAERVTHFGLALGTPSYMSPEQAAGRNDEIDGRTDLFALGATGFRIVTGRRVHEADHPVELVTKMANMPAPPIRSVAPQVSEAFANVMDRALEFHRGDRYPDAAAMRADVKAALEKLASGEKKHRAAYATTMKVEVPPSGREPTVEISVRDLEPPESSNETSAAPTPSPTPAPAPDARPRSSAPPPSKRPRSIVPMLTAIVLGGIALAAIVPRVRVTVGEPAGEDAGASAQAAEEAAAEADAAPALLEIDEPREAEAADAAEDAEGEEESDASEDAEPEERDSALPALAPSVAPAGPSPPRRPPPGHGPKRPPHPRKRRH
jgi:serine/threonine-protein kinase